MVSTKIHGSPSSTSTLVLTLLDPIFEVEEREDAEAACHHIRTILGASREGAPAGSGRERGQNNAAPNPEAAAEEDPPWSKRQLRESVFGTALPTDWPIEEPDPPGEFLL